MNVLSLFDGMSCGQIALEKVGIKVDKYYASEIDKWSVAITRYHYPDTICLGNILNWKKWDIDWSKIDLLIGGSPCQGFSYSGDKLAFNDPRSRLFFEYVDILEHIRKQNPKVKFMLENVRMKNKYLDIISAYLGVFPIMINSSVFVAQNRERYYWANFFINPPSGGGYELKDYLQPDVDIDDKYWLSSKAIKYMNQITSNGKIRWDYHKNPLRKEAACLTANMTKGVPYGVIKERLRRLTPLECERLQTVPDNYTEGLSDNQRYRMLGNGWTVDVIAYIFIHMKLYS